MNRIYLDCAATTKMLPEVKKALISAFDLFGNASSMHEEGRVAHRVIEEARAVVAEKIGAKPNEIIFTSGGSEANNMVLNTFADKKIAVSAIEHPSILEPAKKLKAKIIPVDKKGKVDLSVVASEARQSSLISIMQANNEIGTVQDIKKLTKLAHEDGALFHTDAVQALGKVPVDVKTLGVDYLTISAHKIGGPKGIGALYVKEGSPIKPLIMGGHQENRLRAGTENVLAIVGFAEACNNINLTSLTERVRPARDLLEKRIRKDVPNVVINGDPENCLPNILNVTFAGVEGESILLKLDHAGIAVSTGSACASDDIKSSHVLMAIGADPEKAHGSIRFSFGPENTIHDVDEVMKVLPEIISNLRKMSTIGGKYE